MSKGSKRRPASRSQASIDARWELAFGPKKENPDLDELGRVAYKVHPETGELVPDYMWEQMGLYKRIPKTHFIARDIPEYTSPITGKLISGRKQHRYDLHSNGCRVYEGRESEQRAADSHNLQEERKFDRVLDKSMAKTLNDIEHQNNPPPDLDKNGRPKINWTF